MDKEQTNTDTLTKLLVPFFSQPAEFRIKQNLAQGQVQYDANGQLQYNPGLIGFFKVYDYDYLIFEINLYYSTLNLWVNMTSPFLPREYLSYFAPNHGFAQKGAEYIGKINQTLRYTTAGLNITGKQLKEACYQRLADHKPIKYGDSEEDIFD